MNSVNISLHPHSIFFFSEKLTPNLLTLLTVAVFRQHSFPTTSLPTTSFSHLIKALEPTFERARHIWILTITPNPTNLTPFLKNLDIKSSNLKKIFRYCESRWPYIISVHEPSYMIKAPTCTNHRQCLFLHLVVASSVTPAL